MIESLAILGIIFLLAFLTESFVEYIFGTPFNQSEKLKKYKWALMYVGLLVGVGLSFWYQLDIVYLLADFLGQETIEPSTVGFIMTGFGIGRGSNYMHDVVEKFFKK